MSSKGLWPRGPDLVTIHGVMREAARRVVAVLLERVGTGGSDDPMIRAIRQLNDAVGSVSPVDKRGQRRMTERLWHLYECLADDPQHGQRGTVVAWRKVTGTVLPVPRSTTPRRGSDEARHQDEH